MSMMSYESEFYRLELRDGILIVTYIGGPITLAVADELLSKRLEFTKNKSIPVMVKSINVHGIERDARSLLSSERGVEGLKAGAIIINSAFTKHLANFFMKIAYTKSKMPARVFSDEEEAIKWLKQYI